MNTTHDVFQSNEVVHYEIDMLLLPSIRAGVRTSSRSRSSACSMVSLSKPLSVSLAASSARECGRKATRLAAPALHASNSFSRGGLIEEHPDRPSQALNHHSCADLLVPPDTSRTGLHSVASVLQHPGGPSVGGANAPRHGSTPVAGNSMGAAPVLLLHVPVDAPVVHLPRVVQGLVQGVLRVEQGAGRCVRPLPEGVRPAMTCKH